MIDLSDAAEETRLWFLKIRSEGFDLAGQHRKVLEEAREFSEDPCLEEAADVFITLIGSCVVGGWSLETLADAVSLKMEVNRGRTWAMQKNGTYQHVQ